MRPADKSKVLIEVISRVKERHLARAAASDEAYLDHLIHETIYFEDERVRTDRHTVKRDEDRAWLAAIRRRFSHASELEKKRLLVDIVERHAHEIMGHFSEPVYELSTSVLPRGLGMILQPWSPLKLIRDFPNLPDVADRVVLQGEIERMRKLEKLGTLILAPTHQSNMDSPLIGYAIFRLGLPPFTYGAGLNLFEHRFLGFFMQRLGCYKVDRLKRHSLYKDVLKEYATVTIELGYHNLFFPGGTRSRSGAVEQKLKLGLMGSGIQAYHNNLKRKSAKPRVFIIPCTINYQLVLEAASLVEDYLKEAGKSRYIIMDDEFSMPTRIYSFLRNLVTLDERIYITIGRAIDPFGNVVDDEGASRDAHGREIDIEGYLKRRGELVDDPDRNAQFTRLVGERVIESFMADSMIFSTHALAWTVFERLRALCPDPDFYRFLRAAAYDITLPMGDLLDDLTKTLAGLRRMAARGAVRISDTIAKSEPERVAQRALGLFACYHTKPVLTRHGDRLFPTDMNLLYYYRNRLFGYGLEREVRFGASDGAA
ncbi:MAG: 1-acyl-sn-glycerol-3-phosphate acyltransferase [Deltaproteobacteria bacterium]|nr:1-acyl-sn-glycerol-3-phosphate acyltransferase [Deltaproteobacteria bacterium]